MRTTTSSSQQRQTTERRTTTRRRRTIRPVAPSEALLVCIVSLGGGHHHFISPHKKHTTHTPHHHSSENNNNDDDGRSGERMPLVERRSVTPARQPLRVTYYLSVSKNMSSSDRRCFFGGNWKCNGTKESVASLVETLNAGGDFPQCDVVVCPPFLHIGHVLANIRPDIEVGAQNITNKKGFGAFTGEVSAAMAHDFGCKWVVLGHSERRPFAEETNEMVGEKAKVALEQGLRVIVCIGESLEQREAGKTMEVCLPQLEAIVDQLPEGKWGDVVIAYEPIWSIGTGLTASPSQAQEVCGALREWLVTKASPEIASSTRIIYGGSVKGSNANELMSEADIDGFLVGGASLKADFLTIIKSAEK